MPKPTPGFSIEALDALLAATRSVEEEHGREWFTVRELVGIWEGANTEETVRRRLRALIRAGYVELAGDRLIPNILNPQRSSLVPTYKIVEEEDNDLV